MIDPRRMRAASEAFTDPGVRALPLTAEEEAEWRERGPRGGHLSRDDEARLWATLDAARRERDLAIAHDRQPYPTAEAYERLAAKHAKCRGVQGDLEDALTTLARAGHVPMSNGYCARCGGACILPAAKENSEIIREAGYAKPSPFEPRTDWRERIFRHDDDDPA
jgi:hypothetical protein